MIMMMLTSGAGGNSVRAIVRIARLKYAAYMYKLYTVGSSIYEFLLMILVYAMRAHVAALSSSITKKSSFAASLPLT